MFDTCIILNGPPNVGKDTLADILAENHGFHKHQFKDQLYVDTAVEFKVSLPELVAYATDRDLKELPWKELQRNGQAISPRAALIYTSETLIKPNNGFDYFGVAAVNACRTANSTLAVFSDGGFHEEIECLQLLYRNVYIFRLHRDGCEWGNDSRSYIHGFRNICDLPLLPDHPELAITRILETIEQPLMEIA